MKCTNAVLSGFVMGVCLSGFCMAQKEPVAPATPEAAAEWARTLPMNGRGQALHGILAGWADSDPVAAIQWAKNLDEQEKWVVNNVIAVWGRKDPMAASKWVMEIPEGQDKNQSLESLGQAWGAKDRDKAMKWADGLKNLQEKRSFVGGVAFSYAMSEPEAGIRWAEALTEPKIKEASLVQAVRAWSYQDRPAVEKWLAGLPEGDLKKAAEEGLQNRIIRRRMSPSPKATVKKIILNFETPEDLKRLMEASVNQARDDAITQYVLKWFEQDKEKATQWVSATLKGYVLGVNAGVVAREWSKQNLPAAAEWVRQIPPFFRDFVARMGAEWATDQPKEVAEVVLKWPDDSRKYVVMRGVCEAWAKRDPSATLKWVQALPQGDTRTGALKGLVIGWSKTDVAACRVWADKITNEEDQKEARHYIIHGLARSKPQEAIAYLKTFPDGESNGNLLYCLGKEWALVDGPAAAEWAKSLPAGPKQDSGLQAVLRQWVYADAVRSADWAEKIPEKQSRSLALKSVMENWVEQNPLEALAWAQQIKDSEGQLEALTLALGIWGQSNRQEALDWSNKLPDGKQKDVLLKQLTPVRRRVVREEKVKVGQEAPLFEVKTVDGKEIKLADFKGKYVLLDFWATWCGPCVGETPNLKAVFEKYGKREDFAMIGLSLDKEVEKPMTYAKQNGCDWVDGFLGDWGKDEVTKKYGVSGIPSIWLIGPDGKVVASRLRGDGIMQAVSSALDQKK